jgi:very-short-patch-repair endonuclease
MPQKNKIPSPFFNAAPVTVEKARKLRKRMTPAEEKFWPCVRNRRFKGLKFRRQHPVDRYIVDFICMEKKLVIEIDGGIHQKHEQKEYDRQRTVDLEKYGLIVLRFTNEEILNDVFKVLKEIKKYV